MTSEAESTFVVPGPLHDVVHDALRWLNETQSATFEVTGLVGEDTALAAVGTSDFELGLVLCDGEICMCEQVYFELAPDGYRYRLVDAEKPAVPPLLDPPAGLRSSWLDDQLEKHEFLLLLFYRGLW